MKFKGILILMIIIILASCGSGKEDSVTAASSWDVADKEALAVFTEAVREEPFVLAIEASGILEGIREADVISETTGLIRSVSFEIGDYVNQGDVLLTVEDRLPEINFNYAQQDLKTAELEFDALRKSYDTGGTSRVVYNQGLTRMESARLRMEQARDSLENTMVRAPLSGYISNRDSIISVGSYIQMGLAVTHIVDNSSFKVNLSVGEDEIPLIQSGSEAQVIVNPLPEYSIKAVVRAVSPGSRRAGGGFPVIVTWVNSYGVSLKSGMSALVKINPTNQARNELIIPASAVVYRNGLPYVFRIRDDAAEAVEVVILRSLGDRMTVRDGLIPGEPLIVSGLNSLIPGDPVMATPLLPEISE
ncbi:efflux RND transporter periplasmic adaptor subunit [Oceanispirochaeta sp.]|uniref:efflux RND transporter periplasmic adaptor subunit n=1 Tax=Oceanispirochaeta sp. TaxID=2035350 RepID=UPI00261464CD|nr:efflux RND transporter periplasmic adaptor subunit [Oceanispirochaeta sp.]MDA3958329.1 efflux RND transporter periplasmic adaptor subunit [Oceanispirochaeta sp.]